MASRILKLCRAKSELLLEFVVGIVVLCLMMVTVIDVIGRYLVNMPLRGSVELTEILLAIMIASALPLVTARSYHVEVDLFKRVVPAKFRGIQMDVVHMVSGVALLVLSNDLVARAERVLGYGEHTAYLKIPLGFVIYYLGFMFAVVGLIFLALPFSRHYKNKVTNN